MIDQTIDFLTEHVNKELRLIYGIDEDKAVMGNLVEPGGNPAQEIINKVVVTLLGMEQITNAPGGPRAFTNGGIVKKNDPVLLNLYLMFSANYETKRYQEALKMLSTVMGIFQANSVFPKTSFSNVHPAVDRVSLEIVNLPLNEQMGVWNSLGAKCVPSVMYKLRLVAIDVDRVDGIIPEITGLSSRAAKKNQG